MGNDTLYIVLKGKWFRQIASGEKIEDYRRADDPRWQKKLEGRTYKKICLKLGYPRNDETDKIIWRDYSGFTKKVIVHEEFGGIPTEVFAIKLTSEQDETETCIICGKPFTEQEWEARHRLGR